ncbi:MAG: flippase [Candidatus Omnitrophica bacterium]|nr:flippase [Candidatus Omnitrophota bacterium]
MKIKSFAELGSLLTGHHSLKQLLFKNTFWVSVSLGVGQLLRAALFIYMARILQATHYGIFSFVLAFVSLFTAFFDLGLSSIITREFSQNKEREKDFYSLVSLKFFVGLVTILAIVISSFFITPSFQIRKAIWIMAFFSFLTQFFEVFYAFLRARQRMEYEAWANIFQTLLLVSLVFFVLFRSPSVINISQAYLLSGLIALGIFTFFFHRKILPFKLSFGLEVWSKFLKMSWPLALTSIFTMLYSYTDSIIMGYLSQMAQAGWYNASLRIVKVAWVPGGIICISFYPVLTQFADKARIDFQRIWDYFLGVMFILALPIVFGGMALAERIIITLYGQGFDPSILTFRILIVMQGVGFVSVAFSNLLVAVNQQKKIFWTTVSGAVMNIILNLILIPRFSLYGAAVASLISYLVVLIFYFWFSFRFVGIVCLSPKVSLIATASIFSSIAMFFAVITPFVYKLNVLFSISIGACIYGMVFLSLALIWNGLRKQ